MTTTGIFSHRARRPFEMVRVRERSKTEQETGKEGKKENSDMADGEADSGTVEEEWSTSTSVQ